MGGFTFKLPERLTNNERIERDYFNLNASVEYWKNRATKAEQENNNLLKIISEQQLKIKQLEDK